MPEPQAAINAGKCHPEKYDGGIYVAVLACPANMMKQEESYGIPFPIGLCKGSGLCVLECPFIAHQQKMVQ